MRIIASANQKGGCGKTTTAINLSFALASKGQSVLLIDCDPQAHATMGLNVMPSDLGRTIYEVMRPNGYPPTELEDILLTIGENFDLAPSSGKLSAIEQELSGVEGRESRLHNAIQSLGEYYDFIIIDSPPSIGHLCFNALRASDEVIIPIDLSLFSLRGVSKLIEIAQMLKENLDHDIISRALITMYDQRTRYARHVLEKVKEEFGDDVFETVIRYNIRLREAVDYGSPIGEYDKHSIGHKDYEDLADEVMRSGKADDASTTFTALAGAEGLLDRTESYQDTTESEPEDDIPVVDTKSIFRSYS